MLPGSFPSNGFPERAWPDDSWPGYGGLVPPIPPTPHHKDQPGGGRSFEVVFPWEVRENDDEEVILIASMLL